MPGAFDTPRGKPLKEKLGEALSDWWDSGTSAPAPPSSDAPRTGPYGAPLLGPPAPADDAPTNYYGASPLDQAWDAMVAARPDAQAEAEQIVANARAARQAPAQPTPQPSSAAPRGPAMPPVPPEYAPTAGGLMFPPGYEHEIASASVRGDLDPRAEQMLQRKHSAWLDSMPGRYVQLERTKADAQAEQDDFKRQSWDQGAASYQRIADRSGDAQRRADEVARQAAQRRQRLMTDYETQMNQYRSAVEQVKQAKIDPQRYWKQQGTGMRILAAIAVGLGAVGETVGMKNHAADTINRAIDADIAAQQANIDNARQGLGDQRGILAFMRERIDDSDQAERAARVQIYENLAAYVEQQGAQAESALRRNKAKALAADLRGRKAIIEGELEYKMAEVAQGREQARLSAMAADADRKRKAQERQARMQALVSGGLVWSDGTDKDRQLYSERAGGFAPDQATRQELDELYASTDAMVQTINELSALGRQGSRLSIEDRALGEQKQAILLLQIKEAYKTGAIDAGMVALASKIISNPTAFTEPSAMAKLKGLKDNTMAARRIRARSKGLQPGVMMPGLDKDGNPVMRRGVMMPGKTNMRRRIEAAQDAAGGVAPSDSVNSAFRPE